LTNCRIALANLPAADTPEGSVELAVEAIAEAGRQGVQIICFPECFIPGYRWNASTLPPPSLPFLEDAWNRVSAAAKAASVSVKLGTERPTERGLQITARVYNPDGSTQGWQDKVQLDPSEEAQYPAFGNERRVFTTGEVTFGVVICHEGWRYPETVRWAARRGAQIVFHPYAHVAEPGSYRPETFAHPDNSFHEKAVLCRAAENTSWFASVNSASYGAPATSAIARPDGTLLCYQPYGQAGLLIADLDLNLATLQLAERCRTSPM
jgi:predicted amidohydrolase